MTSHPQGPAPGSPAGAGASVLDGPTLDRLHALDPRGTQGVVERVLRAYEASLVRHGQELVTLRAAADADGLATVAHTLKSSSASVGALRLSRLCAEVERSVRQARLPAAALPIEALIDESKAVLAAVRAMLPP